MTTTSSTQPRTPGWKLVRDSFMTDPLRIRTNVELGNIRGVQAFHQRISNLKKYGYVVTEAIKLKPGHYAYCLVGYDPDIAAAAPVDHLPMPTALPALRGIQQKDAAIERAEILIAKDKDALASRGQSPTIHPPASTIRQRDEARQEVEDVRDALERIARAMDPHIGLTPDDSLRDIATDLASEIEREFTARTEAWVTLRDALGQRGTLVDLAKAAAEAINAKPARAPRAAPRTGPREHRTTGPEAMRKVLTDAGAPVHSTEIANRVISTTGDAIYKGKTPAATMAAQLATSHKEGGQFVRTEPGCFGLRDWDAATLAKPAIRQAA